MITLAAAASHSVIPKTFSGNSLAAEIHLQIFSVSPFPYWRSTDGISCFQRGGRKRD